jgi:ADP-dependent phosphofructokinase/glucokinase
VDDALADRWEAAYRRIATTNPLEDVGAFLAYNSVVDLVRPVDDALLASLPPPEGEPPPVLARLEDLSAALALAIRRGGAAEHIASNEVISFLAALGGYEERTGGQAAIVAHVLSRFHARRVVVHADRFSPRLGRIYEGTEAVVARPSAHGVAYVEAARHTWACAHERHYILEFGRGTAFAEAEAPRANRLIVCPDTPVEWQDGLEEVLPHVAKACDAAFFAGFNHMGGDYDARFEDAAGHLAILRKANPRIVLHLETTYMADAGKREALVERLLPRFDSVGLNEVELADTAAVLGLDRVDDAKDQVEAMGRLRARGPRRVHVHALGYYLALPLAGGAASRDSHLFAALLGAAAAAKGRFPRPEDVPGALAFPLAREGLAVLARLGLDGPDRSGEGDGVLVVPTKVAPHPLKTVGLGDVISGSAFFAEVALAARRLPADE